jgi:hypothetical protein
MFALFAFKVTLVPAFLLVLSLAGRKWGSAVSGWLVALPVVAGPIVFFIGLEQGEVFAASAARGTITGLASLALYCLVYSRAARRAGWAASLLSGWAIFFLSTFLLNRMPLSLPQSLLLALGSLAAVFLLLPEVGDEETPPETPSWEIAARMGAAAALVLLLTALARPLGSHLAGLLVPFPVAATVLTVFTHHYQGAASAIRLLRGLVPALWTMALFFLVVALAVERTGVGVAFALATGADLIAQWASFRVMRRFRTVRTP